MRGVSCAHEELKPSVACVILAAGASSRMGTEKLRLPIAGKSLLRRVAEQALASTARPVIVVLSDSAGGLRHELEGLPVHLVINHRAQLGQSSSLRAGVEAVPEAAEGAVVLLADQPLLAEGTIDKLIEEFHASRASVVASDFGTWKGPPALFGRLLFPHLMALRGDQGARRLLEGTPDIRYVRAGDPLAGADVDTWDDYVRVRREVEGVAGDAEEDG